MPYRARYLAQQFAAVLYPDARLARVESVSKPDGKHAGHPFGDLVTVEPFQRKLDAALAAVDADLPEDLRARMAAGVPDKIREARQTSILYG